MFACIKLYTVVFAPTIQQGKLRTFQTWEVLSVLVPRCAAVVVSIHAIALSPVMAESQAPKAPGDHQPLSHPFADPAYLQSSLAEDRFGCAVLHLEDNKDLLPSVWREHVNASRLHTVLPFTLAITSSLVTVESRSVISSDTAAVRSRTSPSPNSSWQGQELR